MAQSNTSEAITTSLVAPASIYVRAYAEIKITTLPDCLDLMPTQGHASDIGYDLKSRKELVLDPTKTLMVPTGVRIYLAPNRYDTEGALPTFVMEAQVRSRSGLAAKSGVMVLNSPGTIDPDYTGEIQVILYNAGPKPLAIQRGDRIAQLVFNLVPEIKFQYLSNLDFDQIITVRGAGGFGSTGN